MSETPTKEEWIKWRTKIDTSMDSLTQTINLLQKQGSPGEREPTETNQHPVHTLEELLDCPECMKEGEAKVLKHVVDKHFKDADYECEECGLPAKSEESGKEDWECPSCKHKYAKPKT